MSLNYNNRINYVLVNGKVTTYFPEEKASNMQTDVIQLFRVEKFLILSFINYFHELLRNVFNKVT